jgi:hypothetical protein
MTKEVILTILQTFSQITWILVMQSVVIILCFIVAYVVSFKIIAENIRYHDPSEVIISQTEFKNVILRHVVLTKVLRQSEGTIIIIKNMIKR